MLAPIDQVRADFDRLAKFASETWNHNSHYHAVLLRNMPFRFHNSLEIGSGAGAFARLLAARSDRVLAIDLSPEMVRIARQRSQGYSNISFVVADVSALDLGSEQFDVIVSIATLHHLPLESVLEKIKEALRPGGTIAVLDLYKAKTIADYAASSIAFPLNLLISLGKNGRLRPPPEERRAWDLHGETDRYLSLAEIRRITGRVLPGAKVQRRLFFRYSLFWKKPA